MVEKDIEKLVKDEGAALLEQMERNLQEAEYHAGQTKRYDKARRYLETIESSYEELKENNLDASVYDNRIKKLKLQLRK